MAAKIPGGTVHQMPADWKRALLAHPKALATWQATTPLARNEWICWVTSGKKPETRVKHLAVGISKLSGGMRRPCCWSGCPHRADKPMSAAQKFVLARKSAKR